MAASDYELKILTYDFVDETKKQIECRFDWGGLAGTERDYTEKLEVFVRYHVVNNAGERRIDREDPATTITAIPGQTEYVYYWDVPDRCIEVEMRVVAYSKMMNSNGNEVPHWNVGRTIEKTTDWLYCGESNKPDKADTPTVTQNPRLGSQVVLELTGIIDQEGANKDVKKVEFQILSVQNDEDDGTILSGQHEATVSSFNTCRYIMPIGNAYGYRFRARLWASKYGSVVGVEDPWAANASPVVDIPGEWSDLTEIIHGAPNSPEILDMKKQNRTQVLISLKKSGYLHHYQFQVASTMDAFTRMDAWELEHPDLIEDDSARQAARELPPPILDEFVPDGGDTESILYTVTQLPTGKLFYRVRAVSAESGGFYSGWSAIFEYKFSAELQKPIVWMNTPFASVGDNSIILNIMHNSPTGTQTTGAIIYYRINSGALIPYPREGIIDPPASGSNVYQVAFPLTDFNEECAIYWQARTAEYGEAGQDERNWSQLSEGLIFWVYEKPVLNITFPDIPQDEWIPAVTEENAQTIPVVSQFPFHFRIEPVLSGDQMITSYFVRLMACEAYGEYDGYGNKRFVNKGEVLYQFHDNSINVDKYLSVTDCSLANGQRYILNVSAYVNTGVTVEAEAMFTVNIAPSDYVIEAVVGQNRENVSMIINPAAVKYEKPEPEPVIKDTWKEKTWGGLTSFNGSSIWTDGDNIYYSLGTHQYVLDKSTDNWVTKSWNVSSFDGSDIWTDGDSTYYSHKFSTSTTPPVHTYVHYILNKTTGDWEEKTWNGDAFLDSGAYIWTDGTNTYYSHNYDHYVLDKATSTWSEKTWSGREYLNGDRIWTDGTDVYYSNSSTQYVLDKATSTWSEKTWNGLSSLWGHYIWTDGTDVYYSYDYDSAQYVLDKATSTWNEKTWKGEDDIIGSNIWTDGTDIYYSGSSRQYVLAASEPEPETEHWEQITMTGRENVYPGYMWTDGEHAYYSYGSTTYVLNTDTYTWEPKTWVGAESIYFQPRNIWTDGERVYHSDGYSTYVLDKETSTWTSKTWTGISSLYGINVWTDGTNTYYSESTEQYVLNKSTSTWEVKTWNGTDPYSGEYVWTDGENTYYTYGYDSYVLDKETSTWARVTFTGEYAYPDAEDIWTDGRNAYWSSGSNQYVLNKETLEWEVKTWDGMDSFSTRYIYTDGTNMYYSDSYGSNDYVLIIPQPEPEPTRKRIYVDNILLSIYRKNQDGTMVAIAENFENQDSVFVTDPHPNLMKNSYRIVGRDKNSGAMTFVDTPEYKMDCTDIIIQWDENVHFTDVEENSLPAEYAGNTLRLPYNIDVSESANIENSMVNYVGRKNPVSYYGTQTGYTATWNTVIPKSDRDTIALLRKLQVYPGDVYVREPSGTGYWAHVTVSFPINHVELTVSVSISITRVEGGM